MHTLLRYLQLSLSLVLLVSCTPTKEIGKIDKNSQRNTRKISLVRHCWFGLMEI
jgi:hypothetical protein